MSLYSAEIRSAAAARLTRMTLREKIGQMVQFSSREIAFLREKCDDAELVERYPFGSFFTGADVIDLIGGRIKNEDSIEALKKYSRTPLLITGDLENGAGKELLPNLHVLGATRDPNLAYEYGKVLARRALHLGFHWTFGPVVDVLLNWISPAIGGRAMSSDPDLVAEMGSAIIRGMQEQGLCATAKHFPGDGYTNRNQHLGAALDEMTRAEWEKIFGKIYRRVIGEGVRSIMAGHIGLTCADHSTLPATLSEKLSTTLLRTELNFEGVLVSDALIMSGFVSFQDHRKRLLATINAGSDVLLWPEPEVFDIVEQAVVMGDVAESRINEAAQRVLEMKVVCGIFDSEPSAVQEDPGEEFDLVAKAVAEKGIVTVSDRNHSLPLAPEEKNLLVVIADEPANLRGVDLRCYPRIVHLLDELEKRGANLTLKSGLSCLDLCKMETHGITYDAVLVLFTLHPVYSYRLSGMTLESVWMMSNYRNAKVIGVTLYSPFLITENPHSPATVVNVCDDCPACQRAAVRVLYGEIPVQNTPAVDLQCDNRAQQAWQEIRYRSLENT